MPTIKINVKASNDKKYEVEVDTDSTVQKLKEQLVEKAEIPVDRQRLIYSGRVLKDAETLGTYKLADGHTLHLVRGAAPTPAGAAPTPAAATSATTGAPTTPTPAAQPPNPLASGQRNPMGDLYGGLAGMGGGFGGFGAGAGAGAGMPDMGTLMDNPGFMQTMSSLMSNPQMMDAMIAMNPQLAQVMTPEMRQMMQSPQFQQMMSDPNTMRMMMQMSGGMGLGGGMGGLGGLGGFGSPATLGAPQSPAVAGNQNPASGEPAQTSPAANPLLNMFGGGPGAGTQPNAAANPAAAAAQMQLLSQMLGGGASPMGGLGGMFGTPNLAPQQPQQPPEERFATQIQQLSDMGFWDREASIRALTATNGNVNGAVEYLLSHPS